MLATLGARTRVPVQQQAGEDCIEDMKYQLYQQGVGAELIGVSSGMPSDAMASDNSLINFVLCLFEMTLMRCIDPTRDRVSESPPSVFTSSR